MELRKHEILTDIVNSKGYVVRKIEEGVTNTFGIADIITIENGQFRIEFTTNILQGRNYFKILTVTNYLQEKTYKAQRYHHKFIPLINSINGETFVKLNEVK